LTTLIIWVLFINVYRPLQLEMPPHAQETADYIRTQIPRQAVIESWEWELDALSSHWNYHHPNQRYLFLAIRQFSQEQKPFDLDYDVLQADPDYLITGPFSDWTHLYEMSSIQSNFRELARFGVYRIYQRVRR
jgi:hypothetical protein